MIAKLVIFLLISSALFTGAQDAPPEQKEASRPPRDSILFRNGDILFGALKSIDLENGIFWDRPDAVNTFAFSPEAVSQVELASLSTTNPPASSNLCQIQLTNGDQFQGDLISYDGEKVTVETWF